MGEAARYSPVEFVDSKEHMRTQTKHVVKVGNKIMLMAMTIALVMTVTMIKIMIMLMVISNDAILHKALIHFSRFVDNHPLMNK